MITRVYNECLKLWTLPNTSARASANNLHQHNARDNDKCLLLNATPHKPPPRASFHLSTAIIPDAWLKYSTAAPASRAPQYHLSMARLLLIVAFTTPRCAAPQYVILAGTHKALLHSKARVYYVMKRWCLAMTVTYGHHRRCPWNYGTTNPEITRKYGNLRPPPRSPPSPLPPSFHGLYNTFP